MEIVKTTNKKGDIIEYKSEPEYYDGEMHHFLYRRKNNKKWKFAFSCDTLEESNNYLENPQAIEAKRRMFLIAIICIVIFLGTAPFWLK